MLSDQIFSRDLARALVLVEDLESKMGSLIKQVEKLMRPPKRDSRIPENEPTDDAAYISLTRKHISILHRYARRVQIKPDPENIVRSLAQYDPTGNKATYMPWIIRVAGNGSINLPEDSASLTSLLDKFTRAKKSTTYKLSGGPRDIMQIKTFPNLLSAMSRFKEGGVESLSKRGVDDWASKLQIILPEDEMYATKMFDPRKYTEKVDVIATGVKTNIAGSTYGIGWTLKAHATPQQLQWVEDENKHGGESYSANINPVALGVMDASIKAPGSVWCTAGPYYADSYLSKGPMYLFFKKMSESNIVRNRGLAVIDGDEDLIGEYVAYALADYHFTSRDGWTNRLNEGFSKIGPTFLFYLCKLIIAADEGQMEQFGSHALRRIMSAGSETITRAGSDSGTVLPGGAADIIKKAVAIARGTSKHAARMLKEM